MTDNSIIKHYKKQLIYRQNDFADDDAKSVEPSRNGTVSDPKNRMRRKRKNKNCRGQFRHEAMELIKLGASKYDSAVSPSKPKEVFMSTPRSVIQSTVIATPPPKQLHSLPQMVPERPKEIPVIQPPGPFPMPLRPIPLRSPTYPLSCTSPSRVPIRHPTPLYPHPPPYHHPLPNPVILPREYPKKRKHNDEAIDLSRHKCHCECGKTYGAGPQPPPQVIVSVPSTYTHEKRVNTGLSKSNATSVIVPGRKVEPSKLPFLIDDLLGKNRESGVIVTPKLSDNRRQSVEIDTISISSSSSESVRSPKPKPNAIEQQIPHGKLFYYKNNNSFIRYFDETQKKLFIDNISDVHDKHLVEDKEIIELPRHTAFNSKDNLTVEEYVFEMTQVERYIPKDFFLFYKFVTGYQICNNNLPVSFLTFLKVYNTNGLKLLLERYVNSLKEKFH